MIFNEHRHSRNSGARTAVSPRRAAVSLIAAAVVISPSAEYAAAVDRADRRNSLVVVNGATGATVLNVALCAEPLRVTYGANKCWTVAPHGRSVVAVDPRTGAVRRWKVGEEPFDVAVGEGAAWIPDHDGARLWRLDLATGEVTGSHVVNGPQLAAAYAFGAAWVVGADHRLRRFDPHSLQVTDTIPEVSASVEGYEPKMTAARHGLWVADAVSDAVVKVNPRTLRITFRRTRGGAGVAANRFGIWSTDSYQHVWRVAGGRLAKVRTGSGAIDVAADKRSIRVVNRFDRTLVRIDPRRLEVVRRTRLRRSPIALAVGGGFICIAVR